MIAPEAVAVVLLAAGMSTRFGPCDKLAASLDGISLGLHAARTLGKLPFEARIAVTRLNGPDFAAFGFAEVVNMNPSAGQSGSIRLGLAQARLVEPKAVLIALADMPFVTIAHFGALMTSLDTDNPIVGSTDGNRPSPPALFDASRFQTLEELSGDVGARALLQKARLVAAPSSILVDVDTPDDLLFATRYNKRDDNIVASVEARLNPYLDQP